MTQLYVGNLSADGDEKAIRTLFGKYGVVREVLMKNGYAFVEYESSVSAEEAARALNGSDILGHPMIVEPSHQQRLSSRRKAQFGRVEVCNIPAHLSYQMVEVMLSQVGSIIKLDVEEAGDYGLPRKLIVTYESQEQAQRAAATFKGDEHSPRVLLIDVSNGMRNGRKGSPGIPTSPSKNNSDFPLRILVPSDMVGAIIGKDGATIRMITQITKARVDVHRRENLGSAEKAITIIGPPECCTEACYQIMKIMQNELLMTSGMFDNGKYHEPLPVVPLKILAHNELVGRVIGKGGNTLKRIMAESGTKITISKLKDLTAFNMERTITILGTIDNCKKAESLISAKLRASYESDMAQFIPEQNQTSTYQHHQPLSPSPTDASSPSPLGIPPEIPLPSRMHPQSLPATPTATSVRTFTDFSGEHTRLTTLHGSTGALEVNNLGGFKLGPIAMNGQSNGVKYPSPFGFESMFTNGMFKSGMNGHSMSQEFVPSRVSQAPPTSRPSMMVSSNVDDEISDVFGALSMADPMIAAPGYGRARNRRMSAPVSTSNGAGGGGGGGIGGWGGEHQQQVYENGGGGGGDVFGPPKAFSSNALSSYGHRGQGMGGSGWNSSVPPQPAFSQTTQGQAAPGGNIWSNNAFQVNGSGGGSRPGSQTSSYGSGSGSDQGSLSGYSPLYSPTSTTSLFSPEGNCLIATAPMPEDQPPRSAFKPALAIPSLTTVAETPSTSTTTFTNPAVEDDDFFDITSAALELIGDFHPPTGPTPLSTIQW